MGEGNLLVLSRRIGERIQIGVDVWLTILEIGPDVVRLGIEAPQSVRIMREELLAKEQGKENK